MFRIKNTINILMVFDQLGSSFELAEQIVAILFFYLFGYLPELTYSAIYCILMVCLGVIFNLIIVKLRLRLRLRLRLSDSGSVTQAQ